MRIVWTDDGSTRTAQGGRIWKVNVEVKKKVRAGFFTWRNSYEVLLFLTREGILWYSSPECKRVSGDEEAELCRAWDEWCVRRGWLNNA